MKNKILIKIMAAAIALVVCLFLANIYSFPTLKCGDSNYYQFRDVEGGFFTMNTKNNHYQYNPFPYFMFSKSQKNYPLVAKMGDYPQPTDPHVFVAKEGDDIEKDIQNLRLCFPILNIKRIADFVDLE